MIALVIMSEKSQETPSSQQKDFLTDLSSSLPVSKEKEGGHTPIMQQYLDAKKNLPDTILFFQMGDFFELFYDDALVVADFLSITLTHRHQSGEKIPMCGVPVKAHEVYLQRLIQGGFKVAVCAQTETPKQAKKRGSKSLVQREVTQIFTKGTLTGEAYLKPEESNYLLAFCLSHDKKKVGIAWTDISAGTFFTRWGDADTLEDMLTQINPHEILVKESDVQYPAFYELYNRYKKFLTLRVDYLFQESVARRHLDEVFSISSEDTLSTQKKEEIIAIGVISEYLRLTQKETLPRLTLPKKIEEKTFMNMDTGTFFSLEITRNVEGQTKGSLFSTIKKTLTPGGTRLLKTFLTQPLLKKEEIDRRLDAVDAFLSHPPLRNQIQTQLKGFPDLRRLMTRLSSYRGGPRDLLQLAEALNRFEQLSFLSLPSDWEKTLIPSLFSTFKGFSELKTSITRTISEEAPNIFKAGEVIRQDYNETIKALKEKIRTLQLQIPALQIQYMKEKGVPSLKIRSNNILGYFIEIPSKQTGNIPLDAPQKTISPHQFIHRQTLSNCARFTTQHLTDVQNQILQTEAKILEEEQEIFEQTLKKALQQETQIFQAADALALLDVLLSFATLAEEKNYVRPQIENSCRLLIKEGRHPVIEDILQSKNATTPFIKNDCSLDNSCYMWTLTGPNMAGKSTFLRQTALLTLLAQIGCFVPAKEAIIGIVDQIFSRVGASDNLTRGQSTFMVEMLESARILNQASKSSLVILDEVGRGTSTWDGLSIAWAIAEHLLTSIQCRTLFATHYHELTQLGQKYPELANHRMVIKEQDEHIIFMHKVQPGVAQRSYGIHVAELAGLPKKVTQHAHRILLELEKAAQTNVVEQTPPQDSYSKEENEILEKLRKLNIDDLTARDSLEILYSLKELIKEK